jgi:hypothetical protein
MATRHFVLTEPQSKLIDGKMDLHRFRSGQVLILGGPLFEGHG